MFLFPFPIMLSLDGWMMDGWITPYQGIKFSNLLSRNGISQRSQSHVEKQTNISENLSCSSPPLCGLLYTYTVWEKRRTCLFPFFKTSVEKIIHRRNKVKNCHITTYFYWRRCTKAPIHSRLLNQFCYITNQMQIQNDVYKTGNIFFASISDHWLKHKLFYILSQNEKAGNPRRMLASTSTVLFWLKVT